MPIAVLKQAGHQVPKVEKRAIESILFTLDCSELLDQHELIDHVESTQEYPGMDLSDIRPRKGRNIEVRVDNDPLTTSQYTDYTISLMFTTIFKNKKSAVFNLRVHK